MKIRIGAAHDGDLNGSLDHMVVLCHNAVMSSNASGNVWRVAGSMVMLAGVAGLWLLLACRSGGMPQEIALSVLAHAPLWGIGSVFLVGLGTWLLWTNTHLRTAWRPTHPGKRFTSVVMYTRAVCPLCDEARELLAEYRRWMPATIEVDIDQDEQLRDLYGESIPVIMIDDKIRFKGRVSEVLLRRLIEGAEPQW